MRAGSARRSPATIQRASSSVNWTPDPRVPFRARTASENATTGDRVGDADRAVAIVDGYAFFFVASDVPEGRGRTAGTMRR